MYSNSNEFKKIENLDKLNSKNILNIFKDKEENWNKIILILIYLKKMD